MTIERLYKYGRLNEYSEALFSTRQIWMSSPNQLNDPFECRPWFKCEGTQEQVVRGVAGIFRNRHRRRRTFPGRRLCFMHRFCKAITGPEARGRLRLRERN